MTQLMYNQNMIVNPSRNQLLIWISQLTNAKVEKLEHLSDGIQFCELFDKIYPKIINLQKLKRDAKVPLEKEKNFRTLLNGINQMGLCVRINIMDLSQGKITAILELLQWFYKQYKNPLGKQIIDDKTHRSTEPRLFRSYGASLVVRQKSCQKESQNSQSFSQLEKSRRSLDSKIFQKNIFLNEENKSVKSKSIKKNEPTQKIQEKAEDKAKSSKIKSVTLKPEVFEEIRMKKMSSMKKKPEQPEQTLQEILKSTLNADKYQLQKTLIKVTEAVLENNPELEQKMKMVLANSVIKKRNMVEIDFQPQTQMKSVLNSNLDNSLNCEIDTNEEISFGKDYHLKSSEKNTQQIEGAAQIFSSNTEKKLNDNDKKQTVKKSSMKTNEQNGNGSMILSQNGFKLISAQKQKSQRKPQRVFQSSDQNQQQNNLNSSVLRISKIFNPHEKMNNPETHLTEKKINPQNTNEDIQARREYHSENLNINLPRDENVWRQNDDNPYPNIRYEN